MSDFSNDSVRNSSFEGKGLSEYVSDEELANVVLFKNYPDELLKFGAACCVIFMIIGIPGNFATIVALAKCKKVRNATALFIINLSCSDLLFCSFILPLAASTFWSYSWQNGKVLCVVFPLLRYALVAVSLFSVLAITINRYIMITHPHLYPRLYTERNIYMMIAGIWVISFGALIPTILEVWGRFSLNPVTGSCTIIPDENGNTPKQILFIIAFIIPSISIIVCYARVLWIVNKTSVHSRRRTLRSTEMKSLNLSVTTIGKSVDLDQRITLNHAKHHMSIACLPTVELSTSSDSTDHFRRKSTIPEVGCRVLHNEPMSYRQSFMASMRWTVRPRKPQLPTKKDKKLLTMIVAIMLSFCVCYLPITLTKTIFLEFTSHPVANIVGYVLIYFTTCVNPVIYVVMSCEYRQAYKSLFKCQR